MAFDNTITEDDLDETSQRYVKAFRGNGQDREPDLAVDGLSDSILSRILSLFRIGRSRH